METPVIEIARFSAKPGTPPETVTALAQRVNEVLKQMDGFLSRALARDETQDSWIDIVYWQSETAAKKAQESMMQHPDALPYFELMMPESISMHYHRHIDLE